MASRADRVAVVVPCRNEAHGIGLLLDAIAAQSRPPDAVIVADDGSTDDTRGVIERWARAHPAMRVDVVSAGRRGTAAAMNAGIRAADADIIVRLDGHCGPAPDYIARSLDTLTHPKAGVAGGVWTIEAGAPTPTARGIAAVLSHPLGSGGAEYRQPPSSHRAGPRETDTVPFGTFRRDVWLAVGGFDETLVRNQDYDFNYRVRRTGLAVILNPAIISVYRARPTLGSLARQYFQYGFWKVVMLRKFPESIRIRQLLPLLLVPLLLSSLATAFAFRSPVPLWIAAAYLAMNLAGALHASMTRGALPLIPFAAAALIVLQLAWSLGAWTSAVRGPGSR